MCSFRGLKIEMNFFGYFWIFGFMDFWIYDKENFGRPLLLGKPGMIALNIQLMGNDGKNIWAKGEKVTPSSLPDTKKKSKNTSQSRGVEPFLLATFRTVEVRPLEWGEGSPNSPP